MKAYELIWAGFGAVWLVALAAAGLSLLLERVRIWRHFRAEVRAFQRELSMLARKWNV